MSFSSRKPNTASKLLNGPSGTQFLIFYTLFNAIKNEHTHTHQYSYSTFKKIFTLMSNKVDTCESIYLQVSTILLEPGCYRFKDTYDGKMISFFKFNHTQSAAKDLISSITSNSNFIVPTNANLYETYSPFLDLSITDCITQSDYVDLFRDIASMEPNDEKRNIFFDIVNLIEISLSHPHSLADTNNKKDSFSVALMNKLLSNKKDDNRNLYLTTCNTTSFHKQI